VLNHQSLNQAINQIRVFNVAKITGVITKFTEAKWMHEY